MKKIIFSLFLLLPSLSWAQAKDYTINGKISGLESPEKIYLRYAVNFDYVMDSAQVVHGKFRFIGKTADPLFVQLIINHQGTGYSKIDKMDVFSMYLEPGNIQVNAKDSIKNAIVSGSKANDDFIKYKAFIAAPEKTINGLNAVFTQASLEKRKDTIFTNGLRHKLSVASDIRDSLLHIYIREHPDSYFSLTSLSRLAGDLDTDSVQHLYSSLSQHLRSSELGHNLAMQIAAARSTIVGASALDFTQNDLNGKPVTLSDFRGKYVLIDFWASWCGPCRQENPIVLNAYEKYQNKNFAIIGVSLDKDKTAWVNAINKDGLTWTEVSDLKFWNNAVARLYGIKEIPQNFLIDPQGKIVAVNLRGDDLFKKLNEILGPVN